MNQIPTTMQGVYLTGYGGFEKLEVRDDIPVPIPGPGEVLIKVGAAGINNTDINTRLALNSRSNDDYGDTSWPGESIQFPLIQGADICGRIVATGEDIEVNRINERVLVEPCLREVQGNILEQPLYLGSECHGGFAEYIAVASRHAYRINSDLSDEELATFPYSYSIAENMLTRANVTEEDTVLVTGASGGVGSAAIQLAKNRGAKVTGISRRAKSFKVLNLGAEKALLHTQNIVLQIGENSVDVVLDLIAGNQFSELLDVLKPFGRYVVAGAIAGPHVNLDVRTLFLKDLNIYGCTTMEESVFPNLIRLIENGSIKPLVEAIFPLTDIIAAQKAFLKKRHIGKIVLSVDAE